MRLPHPVAPKLLLSIIQNASAEDDDHLQDNWAALLTSAADPDSQGKVLPSFPEILKQLSRDDALYLDFLYRRAARKAHSDKVLNLSAVDLGTRQELFSDFVLQIVDPRERENEAILQERFQRFLDNVSRLGILHIIERFDATPER